MDGGTARVAYGRREPGGGGGKERWKQKDGMFSGVKVPQREREEKEHGEQDSNAFAFQ